MLNTSRWKTAFPLLMCIACFSGCAQPINYDAIRAMLDEHHLQIDRQALFTIIDIRASEEWHSGCLQDAINIPYDTLLDDSRNLVNDGEAFTSIVTNKNRMVVVYGSDDERAEEFAKTVAHLGYSQAYYYQGGVVDWKAHDDYLVLSYEGFRKWYDEYCPFDDGINYLIDVNEEVDYTGNAKHIEGGGGHVPGATHVDNRTFVKIDGSNELKNGAQTLIDALPNKEAKIVIYCSAAWCPISEYAAEVAVSLGYTDVYRFEGGWVEWETRGNELATGEDPGPCAETEILG